MSEVYDNAMAAIEAVAEEEAERQEEPKVTITLSLTSAIEIWGAVRVVIKHYEERINNDLRRDRRLPDGFERKRLDALREGADAIGSYISERVKEETAIPAVSETCDGA